MKFQQHFLTITEESPNIYEMITKMMALTGLQSATNPENAAFVSEIDYFI